MPKVLGRANAKYPSATVPNGLNHASYGRRQLPKWGALTQALQAAPRVVQRGAMPLGGRSLSRWRWR